MKPTQSGAVAGEDLPQALRDTKQERNAFKLVARYPSGAATPPAVICDVWKIAYGAASFAKGQPEEIRGVDECSY